MSFSPLGKETINKYCRVFHKNVPKIASNIVQKKLPPKNHPQNNPQNWTQNLTQNWTQNCPETLLKMFQKLSMKLFFESVPEIFTKIVNENVQKLPTA